MTAVRSSVRCQILSAWLAGETRAETTKVLGVTEQLWREVLADAGFPDRGKVARARDQLLAAYDPATDAAHPPAPPAPAAKPVPPRPAPPPAAPALAVRVTPRGGLVDVALEDLDVDPENLRADLGDIEGLAESIDQVGLLQPIVARRTPQGRLVIVAGHRRHAAVQRLRWATVPVIVRAPMRPDEVLAAMLVENGQRAGLDPIEEARALARLQAATRVSSRQLGARVGMAQSTVDGRLALLALTPEEQEQVRTGELRISDGIRRGRLSSGRTRPAGYTGHPHLGVDHALAARARARCQRLGHSQNKGSRNRVGGVACGECWESVIRADERRGAQAQSVVAGACVTCSAPVEAPTVEALAGTS